MDNLKSKEKQENEDEEEDSNSDTDSLSGDKSVIETMEKHKKLVNGKLSYQIKCSSRSKQYAMEDLLEKDMPEMVKEYKINNSLGNDNEDAVQAIPTSSSEESDVSNEGEGESVCASLL